MTPLERSGEGTGEDGDHYAYNLYHLQLEGERNRLPIVKHRDAILYSLERYATVVLVAPTGSGKSTQLPQYLDAAGWTAEGRRVAITQPRRLAASTVATRVANEMGVELGRGVGYSVRFEDVTSPVTRVQFITDGLLVRELYRDPLLSRYSVIIVDEAHERSLSTDLLLAVLKKVQRKRPDLRIIIASATADVETFVRFFSAPNSDAIVPGPRVDLRPQDSKPQSVTALHLGGRLFPVDVEYLVEPIPDYLAKAYTTVLAIHREVRLPSGTKPQELPGDILVFLTGRDEVETLVSQLYTYSESQRGASRLVALPLYAGLGPSELDPIFNFAAEPGCLRRVIVATNIAETSLTIPNVTYVVDCGFVKLKTYHPHNGWERLGITPTSQASANQRAGRAGRVRAGKVFRLYTEASYKAMPPHTVPEMQRSDLAPTLLLLKALGIHNLARFEFLSPPPSQLMLKALEFLYALQVIDLKGQLTIPLGTHLAELPIHPSLGKMLFESVKYRCTQEILTVAAMVSIKSVFFRPAADQLAAYDDAVKKFAVEEGDLLTYLNVFNAYQASPKTARWCQRRFLHLAELQRAEATRRQLKAYVHSRLGATMASCGRDTQSLRKCILSAYFHQVASFNPLDGSLQQLRGRETLYIHPDSVLFRRAPKLLAFTEVLHTTKPFARHLVTVEPEWLAEIVPDYYQVRAAGPSTSAIPMLG
ncbi:hypothetical protein L0F63_005559 [Massospora cicadina]|nr:hypothetical protein L0F63_005559 [Massospora cicadina]